MTLSIHHHPERRRSPQNFLTTARPLERRRHRGRDHHTPLASERNDSSATSKIPRIIHHNSLNRIFMPHNQHPRSSLCTLAAETNKKKTRGDRRGRQQGTTRTHSNIQTRSERKQGKETHSTHRERRRREQTRGSPTPPHTHTMQPSTTVPRSTWTRGYSGSSAVLGLPPGPCRPTLSKHSPSGMLRRHRRRGVVESGGKCHGVDRSGQCEACRGQTAALSTGQPLPAPDGLSGVRRRRSHVGLP